MKNYDEVTNELLERRERYVADQKEKRKRMMEAAASLCCVCLIALMGFGMWQGGMFSTTPPDKIIDGTVSSGIKDTAGEGNGESADSPAANNKIVINSIEGISSAEMGIALMGNDFVEMTRDEMIAYYGVDYIPEIPADIKPWEDEKSGIYKRNGGTGEVYFDQDKLSYSNEDFTRNVCLTVDKGSYVFVDFRCFGPAEEKSVINNVEVMLGQTEHGDYYAEFMYRGVGFLLWADGVTEEEFVAVIASVVG